MGYDKQDPNPYAVGGAALLILGFTVACGLFVQGYFNQLMRAEYHQKVEATENTQIDKLEATSQKQLTSYGWVDQGAQTVHLPIDRAIELTVKELQK